jgi:hypothetical protein
MADKPILYAPVPEFGQLVEYITQGPLVDEVYGVMINTVPLAAHDLAGTDPMGGDVNLKLGSILVDFVKVLAIKIREMDLTSTDFSTVIPVSIRTRINVWLTNRGWANIPAGWTYRQLFVAIKAR